jgi:Big-like domain-containing protein
LKNKVRVSDAHRAKVLADYFGTPNALLPTINRCHPPSGQAGSSAESFILLSCRGLFMKRFLPLIVLTAIVWAGCGGKKSTPAAGVAVTISPTSASVAGGATQPFTATVTGSTNTTVTWQVNGENGGDAIIGTISSTGVYTAPNVLPTTTTVTVTATSQADTTMVAAALVTLTAPAVTITLSPTSATLAAGATQQFTPTVTVTGSSNNAVNWTVNGIAGGNATVGTIDSTGLYTAPASPPNTAITVTATSQANTTFSASAPVTVQFGNASLKGNYVFLATQPDNSSGSGFAYRGGTFAADGAGNITSGVSDSNSASGPTNFPFTGAGAYSITPDGRGTMTFSDPSGTHTFSFALTSSTRGQLIEFDSAGASSGFIRQQDPNALASVAGTFVFSLMGDNGGPSAAVGQVSFAGVAITGTEDTSTAGVVAQNVVISGSVVTPTPNGRGIATINTLQFAFYIIDASTLVLVDIDSTGMRTAGMAFAQTSIGFTNASLGSSAFFANGNAIPGNKPFAEAGRFDTVGGTQFSNGVVDVNNAGTVTANAPFASTATYAVAANGRGTISNGASTFIFWMASPQQAVIMESDSAAVATGLLLQQQTGIGSVTGGYAFAVAGADSTGATAEAIDGQLSTNGFGILSGAEDLHVGSVITPAASLSGSLTIGANGRATTPRPVQGTVTTNGVPNVVSSVNYAFYFVSADRFLVLSTSSDSVLAGVAERQCSSGCQF